MYKYSLIEDAGHPLFIFNTDHNYQVSISFYPVDGKLKSFSSLGTIYNIDIDSYCKGVDSTRVKDLKIGDTVCSIVDAFINQNPESLLTYLCDDSDDKHYSRYRKFKGWASNYKSENIESLNFAFSKPKNGKNYLTGVVFDSNFYSAEMIQKLSEGQLEEVINK